MKKNLILLLMCSISIMSFYAQDQTYGIEKSITHAVKIESPIPLQKGQNSFSRIKTSQNIYCVYTDYKNGYQKWQQRAYSFFLYDEKSAIFKQDFAKFSMSGKYLTSFNICKNKLFYSENYFSDPDDTGYRLLYLFWGNNKYYLDSVYSTDKDIFSSFSKNGDILLVNSFFELPDFYNPNKDDYTYIYHLDDLANGIKKDSVYCKHCSNSTLIDDKLFYTISNEKDEWDNYSWKEIYSAPWGNISDTTRIASRTELLAVSSDGKYILGKRYDLSNGVCVIIDVKTKKYQILLGDRDFHKMTPFYSEVEKKFGFYLENEIINEIIYVDYPKTFPFDALKKDNPLVPFSKSSAIRKMYKK